MLDTTLKYEGALSTVVVEKSGPDLYATEASRSALKYEVSTRTTLQTQRGSAEFWLGVAHGRGVQLVLPQSCTLLQEPKPLYGYASHNADAKLVEDYQVAPDIVTEQTETSTGKRLILYPPEMIPLAKIPAEITDDMLAEDGVPSSLYANR